MLHDPELLEQLDARPSILFEDSIFRATRLNLDPLAPSTRGGRWAPPDEIPVLYTSLSRDGAIAEIVHHWMQLTPLPSKPLLVHELDVSTRTTLRLLKADLVEFGVPISNYHSVNYRRTQEIGAAVAFLEHDGLIVPSARWESENLVLFSENHGIEERLHINDSQEIDWRTWASRHEWLDEEQKEKS